MKPEASLATGLLRYPGGKQKLLPDIITSLPEAREINGAYIEPFVGGASVFMALMPESAVLADLNEELIDLYKAIKSFPNEVWEVYEEFPSTKTGYYEVRNADLTQLSLVENAARLLFLNRTCFKGMWRYNTSGKFNVGYGGQDRRWVINLSVIQEVAALLSNVDLLTQDFEHTIGAAKRGDYIFADPPYSPGEVKMKNEHYSCYQFDYSDQVRLAKALNAASERGVKWAMTNSLHEDILALYPDANIVPFSRGVSARPGVLQHGQGEKEGLLHN